MLLGAQRGETMMATSSNLLVCGSAVCAHVIALPIEGNLVSKASLDVTINSIVADIGLCSLKPLGVDRAFSHIKVPAAVKASRLSPCTKEKLEVN